MATRRGFCFGLGEADCSALLAETLLLTGCKSLGELEEFSAAAVCNACAGSISVAKEESRVPGESGPATNSEAGNEEVVGLVAGLCVEPLAGLADGLVERGLISVLRRDVEFASAVVSPCSVAGDVVGAEDAGEAAAVTCCAVICCMAALACSRADSIKEAKRSTAPG